MAEVEPVAVVEEGFVVVKDVVAESVLATAVVLVPVSCRFRNSALMNMSDCAISTSFEASIGFSLWI